MVSHSSVRLLVTSTRGRWQTRVPADHSALALQVNQQHICLSTAKVLEILAPGQDTLLPAVCLRSSRDVVPRRHPRPPPLLGINCRQTK